MQADKKIIRYRFNVPVADESVQAWMDAQTNSSVSIRQLIRTDIERNGYMDTMCYPVGQLPKRGRPTSVIVSDTEVANQENKLILPENLSPPVLPVVQPQVNNHMTDLSSMTLAGQKQSLQQNPQLSDLL